MYDMHAVYKFTITVPEKQFLTCNCMHVKCESTN